MSPFRRLLSTIALLSSLAPGFHFYADAQTAPQWGVLNVAGQDLYSSENAEYWIGQAEAATGDSHSSLFATSPGSCTGTAATDVSNAVTAFEQWLSTDSTAGVQLVNIAAKWQYYQPDYSSDGPGSPFDPCYQTFLQTVIYDYAAARYLISFTPTVSSGPSWLSKTAECSNCLFVGQTSSQNPESQGTTTVLNLPNLVFNNTLRGHAAAFLDDVYKNVVVPQIESATSNVKTQPDYIRLGMSEYGEAMYPTPKNAVGSTTEYDDQWWAFDGIAQGGTGLPASIPTLQSMGTSNCYVGWYPGKSSTSPCSGVTTLAANQAWYSWYYDAVVDAHAWFFYHLRHDDGYSGNLVLVAPGRGVRPGNPGGSDDLYTELNDLSGGSFTSYNSLDTSRWLIRGQMWLPYFDQLVYQLEAPTSGATHLGYGLASTSVAPMMIDVSSISADAHVSYDAGPPAVLDASNICTASDTDGGYSITMTPAPSTSAYYQVPSSGYSESNSGGTANDPWEWSSVRWIHYVASVSNGGLSMLGENAGSNPFTGTLSGSTFTAGMKDVVNMAGSCGLSGLLWAFDEQLQPPTSYADIAEYSCIIANYPSYSSCTAQ